MIYFYDTCALLNGESDDIFSSPFVISDITWQELKQLKDSKAKTDSFRAKVKRVIRLLKDNKDKVTKIKYDGDLEEKWFYVNNDDRILWCVSKYYFSLPSDEEMTFITDDFGCYKDAIDMNIPTQLTAEKGIENYTGYKELIVTEEAVNKIYEEFNVNGKVANIFVPLVENQYLILKDLNLEPIDAFKMKDGYLEKIPYWKFSSKWIPETKPKDFYQRCAMDSLATNTMTILRGKPGSGKSLLALACVLDKLDRHEIDRIYMIVNPVATRESARLGYLPGDKLDKILDSSVGSFLMSHLGNDRLPIDIMIKQKQLIFVPASDARGIDVSERSCIYITEGQNTTKDLMKLFIQRAGDDCLFIAEGDDQAQVDLQAYEGKNNGLSRAVEVFKGKSCFGTITFEEIYRSEIAKIADEM